MSIRVSTNSKFTQVLMGIRANQRTLIRAQEQVASGRRIIRPSDDPTGTTQALSLTRQLAEISRFSKSIQAGRRYTDTAGSALEDTSGLISEARALLIQSMNGTLSDADRGSLASSFELIRGQLIEVGNQRSGSRYLFAGTNTTEPPWESTDVGGRKRVSYIGNNEEQFIRVGQSVDVSVNVPGRDIFAAIENTGMVFGGATGVSGGLTADEGTGYEYIALRHDSTDLGALSSVGIGLVGGGNSDTFLNAQSIQIDAVAKTIRLGNGDAVAWPAPGTPEYADLVIENGKGGELHLDLTGFTGTGYSGTVTGNGSISLDGVNFQSLTFAETDLELTHPGTGSIIHVNTTGILTSGEEIAQFSGTVNIFDTLQGVVEDLRQSDTLDPDVLLSRLNLRLEELDRNQSNLLVAVGVLGSRSAQLIGAEDRALGLDLQVNSLLSNLVDADFAEVALDLTRSDQALQLAQASGARLIQTSLLNFL